MAVPSPTRQDSPSGQRANRDLVAETADIESGGRSYPPSFPVAFAGGEGNHLIAADGRRYLDFLTGAGVMLLGYGHPAVRAALAEATEPMITGLDLVTLPKSRFLDTFVDILPADLAGRCRIHFCGPTGSDSIEAALKLGRLATGRPGVFAFAGAYHGMSQGALSVTSNRRVRKAGLRARDDVTFLPFPYPFRHRVKDPVALSELCLDHIRGLLEDDHSGVEVPGLMFVEAMQGEGGNVPAPVPFLRGLRALCDEFGILLALDEIQAGMGRTGRWFAFEHAGIRPDMICVSKGVGGGFALSLLVYDERLDVWQAGDHIGTFRGQEFAFRAGRATIEVIRDDITLPVVARKGIRLSDALAAHAGRAGFGELRALGLFIGLECRAVGERSAGETARFTQRFLFDNGVLVERGGREGAVLRFLPPLTVTDADIDEAAGLIGQALARVEA